MPLVRQSLLSRNIRLAGVVALLSLSLLLSLRLLPAADRSPVRWEKEIAGIEERDRQNPPGQGGIVFIGSSSIRRWTSLAQDFPDLPVVNHGFGGSEIADSTAYADRLIFPLEPRLVVMYAGGNDIHNGKSPEQVLADFQAFAELVHTGLPKAHLDYISISPNPARWDEVERVKAANGLIARYCEGKPWLTFINFFPLMLGEDGLPKPEIFVADRLHMNPAGYAIWISNLRPYLDQFAARRTDAPPETREAVPPGTGSR